MSMSESETVQPDFSKGGGILPAVVQDAHNGEVLMVAYLNEEAFQRTCETGKMHYYSRSRGSLWLKGETSGHVQYVKGVFLDCDSDALLFQVEQKGGACHVGYRSCFYTTWLAGNWQVKKGMQKVFDPEEVYSKQEKGR